MDLLAWINIIGEASKVHSMASEPLQNQVDSSGIETHVLFFLSFTKQGISVLSRSTMCSREGWVLLDFARISTRPRMSSLVQYIFGKSDRQKKHEECINAVNEHIRFTCSQPATSTRPIQVEIEECMGSDDLVTVVFTTTNSAIVCQGQKMNDVNRFIKNMLPHCDGRFYVKVNASVFVIEDVNSPVTLFWASSVTTWNKRGEGATTSNRQGEKVVFPPSPVLLVWEDQECTRQSHVAVLRDQIKGHVALCKKSNLRKVDKIIGVNSSYCRWFHPKNFSVTFRKSADIVSKFPVEFKRRKQSERYKVTPTGLSSSMRDPSNSINRHRAALGGYCSSGASDALTTDFSSACTSDLPSGQVSRMKKVVLTGEKFDRSMQQMEYRYASDSSSTFFEQYPQAPASVHKSPSHHTYSESEVSAMDGAEREENACFASASMVFEQEKSRTTAASLADGDFEEEEQLSEHNLEIIKNTTLRSHSSSPACSGSDPEEAGCAKPSPPDMQEVSLFDTV